jgi:predicted adenylyl cyclase CyaB
MMRLVHPLRAPASPLFLSQPRQVDYPGFAGQREHSPGRASRSPLFIMAPPTGQPGCNVELKARLHDLAASRDIARQLATRPGEQQRQRDTYFHCQQGRLKLREIEQQPAELIWYQRSDQQQGKASHYLRVAVSDPAGLLAALAGALGIRCVVAKQREIFFHQQVRIHLDQVDSLGDFLEFEAVLDSLDQLAEGEAIVARLQQQFDIAQDDLLSGSYGEMIVAQANQQLP